MQCKYVLSLPLLKILHVASAVTSSLQHDKIEAPQPDAEVCEYWLVKKNGMEMWLVMICNEEMIGEFFSNNLQPGTILTPEQNFPESVNKKVHTKADGKPQGLRVKRD